MTKTAGSEETELVFLKLGGSLITDKTTPRTPRPEVIGRICSELKTALESQPQLRVLLGHGSGSFGHVSGSKYGTREGVSTALEWRGFAEVWQDAAALNHLVMDALHHAGLAALAFPASAGAISTEREIKAWNLDPIHSALDQGLLPVIYGDVVFDDILGGTILSTEDLFSHLAEYLEPARILLAGRDPGVWKDYPECSQIFPVISTADREDLSGKLSPSAATDVTGGMAGKVDQMLDLIKRLPGLEAQIFSGEEPGAVLQALRGEVIGTRLQG